MAMKTVISPMHYYWRYSSLALSHQRKMGFWVRHLQCVYNGDTTVFAESHRYEIVVWSVRPHKKHTQTVNVHSSLSAPLSVAHLGFKRFAACLSVRTCSMSSDILFIKIGRASVAATGAAAAVTVDDNRSTRIRHPEANRVFLAVVWDILPVIQIPVSKLP